MGLGLGERGGDGGECALFVGQLVGQVAGGGGVGITVVVGGEPHGAMGGGVGDLVGDERAAAVGKQGFGAAHAAALPAAQDKEGRCIGSRHDFFEVLYQSTKKK